jgi:alkylation response protein AidB-like acyl-CoA dehydrogenase
MSEQAELFDLTLTEEQRITRESMQRFAESELQAISRDADEAGETPEGFLDKTLELGLSLIPIPEEFGGAGMPRSPIANVLNAEDLGKGDFSLALAALTPLAFINAVIDNGTEAQKEKFLTPLADEKFVPASIALMEPKATFEPSEPETTAEKSGNDYILNGVKSNVILGSTAEYILVIAQEAGANVEGFIVEKGADGLSIENKKSMGLRPVDTSTITLDNVKISGSNKLGENEKSLDLERLIDLSRLGVCALAVGTCEAVLEYVAEYANERIAFGEPIAYRQSVAFMIANIAIELEAMRLMIWRAASRAEQGLDFHKEAYLAYVLCSDKSMEIGNNGVQVLGGHGFTREHPVELWYRNLRAVGILEGCATI